MNATYPSFWEENANRSFPFAETAEIPFENSCFLDFRAWTRGRASSDPTLDLLWVDGLAALPNPEEMSPFVVDGSLNLFFTISNSQKYADSIAHFAVPLSNDQWPLTLVYERNFSGAPYKRTWASLTVGPAILSILEGPTNSLSPGLKLEPSSVFGLGGVAIDSFIVESDEPGGRRFLSGDISFLGGKNCVISQNGNLIEFNASPGIGHKAEKFEGEDQGACVGITSLESISPNAKGEIQIRGENGITITDYPEGHTIYVGIDLSETRVSC